MTMTNARWCYGCTVFEVAALGFLMGLYVKNQEVSDAVKVWSRHRRDLKSTLPLDGQAGDVQRRVYWLRHLCLRCIVWGLCNPEPAERTQRLEDDVSKWGAQWGCERLAVESNLVVCWCNRTRRGFTCLHRLAVGQAQLLTIGLFDGLTVL